MAQEVVISIWCDVDLAEDKQVKGQTVANPVDPTQEADLCDKHKAQVDQITDSLNKFFVKYGRKASGEGLPRPERRAAKKTTDGRRRKQRRDQLPLTCSVPGCTDGPDGGPYVGKRRSDLRHHVEAKHDASLVALEAKDDTVYTPFHCNTGRETPTCEVAVGTIQGLGMHRWKKHNIPMRDTYKEFGEISKKVTAARKKGERWYPPGTAPSQPSPPAENESFEEEPPAQSPADVEELQKALEAGAAPRPPGVFH